MRTYSGRNEQCFMERNFLSLIDFIFLFEVGNYLKEKVL